MAHGPGLLSTLWRAVRLCFRRADFLVLWPVVVVCVFLISFIVSRTFFGIFVLPGVYLAYSVFVSYILGANSNYSSALSIVAARTGPIALIALIGAATGVGLSCALIILIPIIGFFLNQALAFAVFSVAVLGVFYVWARALVLPSVIALEDTRNLGAVRRAWELTRRHHLRTLMLAVVAVGPTIAGCAAFVWLTLALLVSALSSGEGEGGPGHLIVIAGYVALTALLYVPISAALQTSFYLGLREEERAIEGSLI